MSRVRDNMVTRRVKYALVIAAFLSLHTVSFGLTVIKDSGNTTPANAYLNNINVPTKSMQQALYKMAEQNKDKLINHPIMLSAMLFPAKSAMSAGDVAKHKLSNNPLTHNGQPISYFVIGDDARSIRWAKTNASYLQKIKAFGFLTNVRSKDRYMDIEEETGLKLMIVNLDKISEIVGTDHYPFLVYKNWVIQ